MKAKIYLKPTCPFCIRAKDLLRLRGIEFEDVDVSQNQALRTEVSESVGGYRTVPMIFLDDEFIGGCSELMALDDEGRLVV